MKERGHYVDSGLSNDLDESRMRIAELVECNAVLDDALTAASERIAQLEANRWSEN